MKHPSGQYGSLNDIEKNACSLFESYSSELKKGKLPKGLSFSEINYWNQQFNCSHFTLKDRLNHFKHSKIKLENEDSDWFESFKYIFKSYSSDSLRKYKKAADHNPPPFCLVIFPFVQFAHDQLTKGNLRIENYLTSKAFKDYINSLVKLLSTIASLALTADLKNQGTKDYDSYSNSFYNGYAFSFYLEYSSLARLLTQQTMLWIESTKNFLESFERDNVELSNRFFDGIALKKIKSLKQDEGPCHSSLGPNRIITFSDNRKLIYKTKSAQNDLFYNHLINWLNKVQRKVDFESYIVFDREHYSWHEFIPYQACETEKEVKEYYQRLGYLSAILQILGSTDYHLGNIISKGGQPILIDHETILNLYTNKRSFDIKKAHILHSSDFNYKMLSAFHSEVPLKIKAIKVIKNKEVKLFSKTIYWKGKNIPLLSGQKINPYLYLTQIHSGYTKALKLIIKHQKEFVIFVKKEFASLTLNHRYLHRPSIDYLNLLKQSCEPTNLKTGVKRSLFFESLFQVLGDSKPNQFSINMISKEITAVEQYFWPRFILNKTEVANTEPNQRIKQITLENYVNRQIKKNIQHLKQPENLNKALKNLSLYLKSLPKI